MLVFEVRQNEQNILSIYTTSGENLFGRGTLTTRGRIFHSIQPVQRGDGIVQLSVFTHKKHPGKLFVSQLEYSEAYSK